MNAAGVRDPRMVTTPVRYTLFELLLKDNYFCINLIKLGTSGHIPSTAQLLVALILFLGVIVEPDHKAWDLAYSNYPIKSALSTNPTSG